MADLGMRNDGRGDGAGSTLGELLAELWGERWPDVQAQALELGWDLDSVPEELPPPWEEIRKEAEEFIDLKDRDFVSLRRQVDTSPDVLTAEYIVESFSVGGVAVDGYVLAGIQDISAQFAPEIESAALEYCLAVDAAVDELRMTGRYSKAKFFLPESEWVPTVFLSQFVYKGWAVAYVVPNKDYPQLLELQRSAQATALARDQAIQRYLNGLKEDR